MTKLLRRKIENPFDINPDTIFFSDLHLHDRKEFSRVDPETGLNVRLLEGLNILDQIKKILIENLAIKEVKYLGDIFELKDRIPNHILIEFRRKLDEMLSESEQHPFFYALEGNHDFNIPKYPTLDIFKGDSRFTFISGPSQYRTIIYGNNRTVTDRKLTYFIPFQRNWEDFKKEWIIAHDQKVKPDVICLHQEIPGAIYETGKIVSGIWDLKTDPDILYLSGHLHKSQKVHGIQFLGSPYPTKFLPKDDENYYIWLYNSQTKQLRSLQLNYSKFITLNWHELDNHNSKSLGEIVQGNYIRVVGEIFKEDYDSKDKKYLKNEMEKLGAKVVIFNIKIKHPSQSEISETLIENDDEIIKDYAEKNRGSLELKKLIQVGLDTYESIKG